jgi:large subunit ribosomal protein L21
MYAVIATGGKQYRVEKDGVLRIEKLEAEVGATVDFDRVLMVADGDTVTLGKPLVAGAKVSATVEKHGQTDKVVIVKFRRRKHYKRGGTHRQQYTQVRITAIAG